MYEVEFINRCYLVSIYRGFAKIAFWLIMYLT